MKSRNLFYLFICYVIVWIYTDLPCIVLQSRTSQFWRHQNGSPRWYLATIEAIHQFLVELHTAAWTSTSGQLHAETLAMQTSKKNVSTCVDTSNNREVPDGDTRWDTSAADKISAVCGTSSESGSKVHSSNLGCLENEHSEVNSNSECFGPYKGEYDNLLFFFCYMYRKIHKLYRHEDLCAYKRPLKWISVNVCEYLNKEYSVFYSYI
jgi:hypothetical protein